MNTVEKKLKRLSIFYIIIGWFCFPASFIAPAVIILDVRTESPPFPVPMVLIGIAVMALVVSIVMSVCIIIAGRAIASHRLYMYILIVASILCFSVPIGTVIGIYTLVVLRDPKIKQVFKKL